MFEVRMYRRRQVLTRNAFLHSTTPENADRLRVIPEPKIDEVSDGNLQNVLRTVAFFRDVPVRHLPAAAKQYADPTLHRMGKIVPPLLATLIQERGK
jgi:hypothetical protein